MAMRSPAGAMRYALSLDDAELRNSTVAAVADMWAKKDPAAVTQWVATLPPGATRDAGYRASAWVIGQYDLEQALTLANQMQDAAGRTSLLEGLVTFGLRHDPARALQLASQLPSVDSVQVSMWTAMAKSRDAIAALRSWVETAQAAGRIKYPAYPNPAGVDPVVVKDWEQSAARSGYQHIRDNLDQTEKRAK